MAPAVIIIQLVLSERSSGWVIAVTIKILNKNVSALKTTKFNTFLALFTSTSTHSNFDNMVQRTTESMVLSPVNKNSTSDKACVFHDVQFHNRTIQPKS